MPRRCEIKTRNAPARTLLNRLGAVRNEYDPKTTAEKKSLLDELGRRQIRDPYRLKQLHQCLCFLAAFPDDPSIHGAARAGLDSFARRIRSIRSSARAKLTGSGLVGTRVEYEFSFASAIWLALHFPRDIDIDWRGWDDAGAMDDLLLLIAAHGETQTFDDGEISARDWIRSARGDDPRSDWAWLIDQLRSTKVPSSVVEQLYESAQIPVVWNLKDCPASITHNRLVAHPIIYRGHGLREPPRFPRTEITRPTAPIKVASEKAAQQVIDSVRAALLARSREVYAVQFPNPREVYLADLGCGATAAIIGVMPDHRLSIEGNYAYMMFCSGMPIGYGGVSPMFRQANTGLNILDEYRGGESAYLFTQLLRCFHALFGTQRFVANPYQVGRDNPEALRSGAFWFYYKLGFRPYDAEAAALAKTIFAKKRPGKRLSVDKATMKKLVDSDMHLALAESKRRDFFDESWLGTIASEITRKLGERPEKLRQQAIKALERNVARQLGASDQQHWPKDEAKAFANFASIVALLDDVRDWSQREKSSLVKLMRAKGRTQEQTYARALFRHDRFRIALSRFCKTRARE